MNATSPRRTLDPPAWVDRWVGLPYEELGRGLVDSGGAKPLGGFDCWGLCREIAVKEFGVALPSYEDAYADCGESAELDALLVREMTAWQAIGWRDEAGFVRADTERPGDFLCFRRLRLRGHVAVVAGGGWMIHIEEGLSSAPERYGEGPWSRRLVAIRRHPEIAAVAHRLGVAA